MNDLLIYCEYLSLREQQRLPNQQEQRRALERRIGDWFLFKQPARKSFAATHQRHTRGIWTDSTRRDLLRRIRRSDRLDSDEREKFLKKMWKDEDMASLRDPFDEFQGRVVRAQDLRKPVTPVVNRGLDTKFPGTKRFLQLIQQDRVVNRGNAHTEVRSVTPDGDVLVGWTLDTPGVMIQNLQSGKLRAAGRDKLQEFGVKIRVPGRERIEVDRIQVQKKSPQPLVWLTLVTKAKPDFESEVGQVGATAATAGRFEFITGGGQPFRRTGRGRSGFSVIYGVRRSNFHEQFHLYEDPDLQKTVGGRWTFRLLRLGGRADVPEARRWLMRRADDPTPFIFRNDFEEERDQARKEKNDLIWNETAIPILERMNYFRTFEIEDKLEEFQKSERAKKPPRGGVARFRPRGRLAKAPDIFGETTGRYSTLLEFAY